MTVTEEQCQFIKCYQKLPSPIKDKILNNVKKNNSKLYSSIDKDNYHMQFVYSMDEDLASFITARTDDYTYFNILYIWDNFIPLIEDYFKTNQIYQKYPEILI
jgi:hypothetical protein